MLKIPPMMRGTDMLKIPSMMRGMDMLNIMTTFFVYWLRVLQHHSTYINMYIYMFINMHIHRML